MKNLFSLAALSLLLGACASTPEAPAGPTMTPDGKYFLSEEGGRFGASGAKIKASLYQRGNAFCEERGENAVPLQDDYRDGEGFKRAYAEFSFRCVPDDSHDLMRPVYRP